MRHNFTVGSSSLPRRDGRQGAVRAVGCEWFLGPPGPLVSHNLSGAGGRGPDERVAPKL